MEPDFWQKQTDQPLFPHIWWSRPEQKKLAKRVLIIGGNPQGFDQAGRLHQAVLEAGIGEAKTVLPKELKSAVGAMPDTVMANLSPDANRLGEALSQLKAYADWANGTAVIQPGNNSRTALLLGRFTEEYDSALAIGDDFLNLLKHDAQALIARPNTLFVLSFAGLQHLSALSGSEMALRHDMGLRPLVLALNDISRQIASPIVATYDEQIICAHAGQIVSTKRGKRPDPVMLMGRAATWWLQQPDKPLEALASAVFEF